MEMMRLPGWESRLAATIAEVRLHPYRLGQSDCLTAACAAIRALSGVDLWPLCAGRYRTRAGMLRLMKAFAGRLDLVAAFSELCGIQPTGALMARRGDIMIYVDESGTECLAVCTGVHALVPSHSGWAFVPITACRQAWRIG